VADAPSVYGPRKTLYNRFVRWAAKGVWEDIFHALSSAGGPPEQVLINSSAVKAHRCASGGKGETHPSDRPLSRWANYENPRADRLLLTDGQVADCTAADTLLDQLPAAVILHGDKGYDSDAVRCKIESKGAAPNIPPKVNRRWKNCFSPYLYRDRNAIKRMFGRLKDFRRIATRYDKLARNFLAAVYLAAAICNWL
jgi:transposase